jgi:excisionase family DNA binding protein
MSSRYPSLSAAETDGRSSLGRPRIPRGRDGKGATFFTVAEVAERLNVSTRTVRRWIALGLLRVHRFGRTVRISEADLAAFLATHRAA